MGPHMLWQQLHKTLYELFDIGCDSCICCDSGYCFDTVLVCIVSYIIYTYKYIHFLYCDACSSKRLGWLFCCRYYGEFILLNFHIKKMFKLQISTAVCFITIANYFSLTFWTEYSTNLGRDCLYSYFCEILFSIL